MSSTVTDNIYTLDSNTCSQLQSAFEIPTPLTILQELVKNAVESGASKISIHIPAKSLDFITVIDNGSGISEASLDLLAKRGHTSKISLGCRGNSLAAIATVSAQLKICTRIQGSLVACQLEISQDKKNKMHVAREPGTTVSVILPLCKVPVRYSLIKSQSAHIKAEIREWLNAYHLANYKIEMSLVYAGITAGSQNCQRVINFPGALSLQSAVSRFIGKKHSESIVYVEYPAKRSYSLVVASKSSQLMKGITFEGVFASKSKDSFKASGLPQLSLSINGTVCKPDVFPGILNQLEELYTLAQTIPNMFIGVVSIKIPPSKLDTSLKSPWLLNQFETEAIACEIVQAIVQADYLAKTKETITQQQEERNSGLILYCTKPKRKLVNQEECSKRSRCSVLTHSVQPWHANNTSIPQVNWSGCSPEMAFMFEGLVGKVICMVQKNGSICLPELRKAINLDSPCVVGIICVSEKLIALDMRGLALNSLLIAPNLVKLSNLSTRIYMPSDQLN